MANAWFFAHLTLIQQSSMSEYRSVSEKEKSSWVGKVPFPDLCSYVFLSLLYFFRRYGFTCNFATPVSHTWWKNLTSTLTLPTILQFNFFFPLHSKSSIRHLSPGYEGEGWYSVFLMIVATSLNPAADTAATDTSYSRPTSTAGKFTDVKFCYVTDLQIV